VINVDVTKSVPDWEPHTQPIAAEGTPSVLYIVLDDVGYSAMGAYGGLIETPNIDRIAQRGLPVGHVVVSASFEREGDSMPAEGTLTLHAGEKEIGKGRIKTQPGKFSIAGEGLNVGKDGAEPVTDDYPGDPPWRFTGGTIARAAVDVSGEPFVDLAAEARMAFMRD
jgi:arylsulfatase